MRRAQEEAPIELLIAVTILTFVVIIGFATYQNMCANQFEQKLKASLSKFARDLELVYKGSEGTSTTSTLDFADIGCPGDVDSVRLMRGTDTTCMQHFGRTECLMLYVITRPININEGTSLPRQDVRYFRLAEALDVPVTTIINYISHDPSGSTATCPDMNSLDVTRINNPAGPEMTKECGWSMRVYSLRITKERKNEIKIEDVWA